MTLTEFVIQKKNELDVFQNLWLTHHDDLPEVYPLQMPISEWEGVLAFYMEFPNE